MKPIDIENQVLVILERPGPATIQHLKRRMTTASGNVVTFQSVASAVIRLGRQGLVHQSGEELAGVDVYPVYALTEAGAVAAATARRQQVAQEQSASKEAAHG